ncbi:MAG: YbaN family protein [Acidobacteria bacterium]|nr:YbaN family protein [Acidobacteriota bacterium]
MERTTLKAKLYLIAGWISVALGIIGIPTPLLPTTPFLLLAAFCFARGSQRWHDWLVNHRVLGAYITAFRDQRGLTVKQKWRVALSIFFSLAVGFYFAPRIEGRIGIIVFGVFWLSWIYRYPTAATTPALATPASTPEQDRNKTSELS